MTTKLTRLRALVVSSSEQTESKQIVTISNEMARFYIGADKNEGLPGGGGEPNDACNNPNCSSGSNKNCTNTNCQTTNTTLENTGCTNTGCC